MLRRFSSRQASLYRELLKPCLAGATRYDRIAGYFQSSLLELASESLAGIPHIRIVCNTEVSAEDVKTVRMATGVDRCPPQRTGHRLQAKRFACNQCEPVHPLLPWSAKNSSANRFFCNFPVVVSGSSLSPTKRMRRGTL